MAQPLVVSFSHDLGRAEVRRRIDGGIEQLRASYAAFVTIADTTWTGDRLDFTVAALKQSVTGFIDVEDARVTITATLPLLLGMMADKARSLIQKEGTLLLEKK